MQDNMPKCPHRGCPRSDVRVAKELPNQHEISFICLTCKSLFVRTLPKGWEYAKYMRDLRTGRTFRTSYDKEIIYGT